MSRTTEIELKASHCVDTPLGADLWALGDKGAKHLANNGIERNGGITPIYEQETTFPTAGLQSLITKSGDLLQVDASYNVRINNMAIGNVGGYAVTLRNVLKGYNDAAWTASNTIIGIVKIGQTIRVDEINPVTGAIINTRSATFTMPTTVIINVVLVKYMAMNYADSLQFILSNNANTYILSEFGTVVSLVGGFLWTTQTLAGNTWRSVCWSQSLNLFAAVGAGGTNYAATSVDGITWSTRVLGAAGWNAVCWSPALGRFIAVGSHTGAVNGAYSIDGTTWSSYEIEFASADNYFGVAWSPQLGILVAVGDGVVSHYAASSTDGTSWTGRTNTAEVWGAVCWSAEKAKFICVGTGTNVAYSTNGTSWTNQAAVIANKTWRSVCWSPGLGLFCAVGDSDACSTSTDGATWSTRTIGTGNWKSVCWDSFNGLFIAVGSATNYCAISSDGINWAIQTFEANTWNAVCWSPDLRKAVSVGGGATHYAATGITSASKTTFGWKFAAAKYIIGGQGISGSWLIGDISAASMTAITDATWCVIDQFAGTAFSRAILTFPVKKNAANLLTGIGEVGYNQAGTYSATPVYYGVALAAVTVTISTHAEGPGYSEATFTTSAGGTNIYAYIAPIMQHNPAAWYDYQQSQTQNPALGYGRLNDFVGNSLGATCSLRSVMAPSSTNSAIPSFLSAAIIGDDTVDNLGVPVTNIGEFDEFFVPHIVDNGSTRLNCIYRYNGVLFFFVIQSASVNTIQQVSDNLYMVNTLSPINAIDVANRTLNLGANDYNGRFLFRSSAAIIATVKFAAIIQGPYANSVDAGDRLITQTFATATDQVPGIELPSFVDRAVPQYGVNIYSADLYTTTYQSYNVTYMNSFQSGVLYVSDTRVPLAIGYIFYFHVMQTEIETIFIGVGAAGSANIDYDYLCYEIGNDTPGQYQSFYLYGQTYLFDGNNIWIALFSGSLFIGKGNTPIAPATGAQLIASSPTEILFLSAFDNSLYSFNGGRSITKVERMNQEDTIINGVFSVKDDSLLLNCTNTFLWVRDGVISSNTKKANQTGIAAFDTTNGIVIVNNSMSWRYTFFALAGSTVVPLVWQSGYFGITENKLGIFSAFIATIYRADKVATSLMFTLDGFDTDGEWHEDIPFNIKPGDWTPMGFYRVRIVPQHTLGLALSIGMKTSSMVVLNNMVAEFTPSASATPAASRSK